MKDLKKLNPDQLKSVENNLDDIFGRLKKINDIYWDLLNDSQKNYFKKATQLSEIVEHLLFFNS